MIRTLTCIICPRGCRLTVDTGSNPIKVTGNSCPKGAKYGADECTHPTRTVTGIVRVADKEDTMVSVKTAEPIPKENIFDVMSVINSASVTSPVRIGDVIVKDVYGTDIIATKNID